METKQIGSSEISVSKDDQTNINNFSKLNLQYHEKTKERYQKKEVFTQVEDALTELELCDEDELIKVKFGDCFFGLSLDDSKEYCEKNKKDLEKEIKMYDETLAETQKRMQKLKATLYAKFGNSINLEED